MPDTASTSLHSREQICNALRALAMGAVQKANSGHPGMPMGTMEGISHEAASLALQAQGQLAQAGVPVRVVPIPSTTAFDRQDAACKAGVLSERLPRVAIEAGVTDFWWKYVRSNGAVLGVDRFGESAPAPVVYRHFGLTVENLVATVQAVLSREKQK